MTATEDRTRVFITVICLAFVPAALAEAGQGSPETKVGEHRFVTRYSYYAEQPLTGLVKSRTDPAGRVTRYVYDRNRRLTEVAYADGKAVAYAYDKLGRRTAMKDWTGTTTYKYDTLNRLVKVTQSNGLWVKFEHDWLNRITAIITPGDQPEADKGWRAEYAYDLLGNLRQIRSPVGKFTWEYDYAKGTITRHMPNGVVSIFGYRPDGLLAGIRHEREEGKGEDAKRVLLVEFAYEYQPDGKV